MSKIVKLTQSDIETIVTNIVSEQETEGYELPEDEITYDTSEEKDYSAELEEVDFGGSDGNDFESGEGTPVELALAQGDDGYMYAIDPETRKVISRIEM